MALRKARKDRVGFNENMRGSGILQHGHEGRKGGPRKLHVRKGRRG